MSQFEPAVMAELMHELAQAGSPGNSIAVTNAACASKVTSEIFILGYFYFTVFGKRM